jgi:hypothetical protein
MKDAIIIIKGVYCPDGRSLHMRNLVKFMPRRLQDVLNRDAIPSKY